jgi:tRNA threonylcarbamoyladenosine biosynthesis protein TsaE
MRSRLPHRKLNVREPERLTESAEETLEMGRKIGRRLHAPALLLLSGELGAGKTTLAKGIISGLGAAREEQVTSPTFTLVHPFSGRAKVFHVDLYRIEGFHDLETLGLEDLFAEPAVVLVEWPDKLRFQTDWPVLRLELAHAGEEKRRICIRDSTGLLGADFEA